MSDSENLQQYIKSKSDANIREFCENIPAAAVITTYHADNPLIIYCNKRHEKLSGYSLAEVVGNTPRALRKNTDGIPSNELKLALKKDDWFSATITNHLPDGTPYRVKICIVGIVLQGNKLYLAIKERVQ